MITDTDRLDWLERYEPEYGVNNGEDDPVILLLFESNDKLRQAKGPTLREAIDDGMKLTGDARDAG